MMPAQGPYALKPATQQPLYLTGVPLDGWIPMDYITFICTATDAPIYTVTALADVSATPLLLSVGMKIRCKQNNATIYGIVHSVGSYNGATDLQIYCGTDYSFTSFAQITDVYFSLPKAAGYGFPLDLAKWIVSLTDTTKAIKNSPTAATWINLGVDGGTSSLQIAIPIGAWRVYYEVVEEIIITLTTVTSVGMRFTLSTANNSESDAQFSSVISLPLPIGTGDTVNVSFFKEKPLLLAAKTTYYLNVFISASAAGATSISLRGDALTTIVRATSAYL